MKICVDWVYCTGGKSKQKIRGAHHNREVDVHKSSIRNINMHPTIPLLVVNRLGDLGKMFSFYYWNCSVNRFKAIPVMYIFAQASLRQCFIDILVN